MTRNRSHGRDRVAITTIIISVVALAVSGLSAWATYRQAEISKEAISEKLTINPTVNQLDIKAGTYDTIYSAERAPTPIPDITRLYVIVTVANEGKGSGLITDVGIRATDAVSFSFSTPLCDGAEDVLVNWPTPISIDSGEHLKLYLRVEQDTVESLACSGTDSTIGVYLVDSSGTQISADTNVLVPRPEIPCEKQTRP